MATKLEARRGRLRPRTWAAAFLVAAMFVAAACGDDDTGAEPGTTVSDGNEVSGGEELRTITIGQMMSATGSDAATWGEPIDNGFRLAMSDIEATGLLADVGVELELRTEDDASDETQAVTVFNQFLRDDIEFTFSSARTSIGSAVSPIANDEEVMYVNVGSGGTGDDEPDFYFRMNNVSGLATANGRYIAEAGFERPVAIVDGDIPAYVVQGPAMEEVMAEHGLDTGFLTTQTVATADTDFSSILTNVAQENPDVIWLGMIDATAGNLMQQMQQVEELADVQVVGNPGTSAQLFDIAGDAAVGMVWALPWAEGAPGTEQFAEDYEREYGERPSSFSALGYQAAWLYAAAIAMVAESDGAEAVDATSVREIWPEASQSDVVQDNGLIEGFEVDAAGVPSYPGVIGTFDEDGNVVLVD